MNRSHLGLDRRQFVQRLAAVGLLTVPGAGVLSACATDGGPPTTPVQRDGTMADAAVLDSHMAFEDTGGGGVPVVFLHGNPTSSYLWRGVLPHVAGQARCLAPDLIGMGRSGKPEIGYRFADHARYLDAWFDAVGLDEVVLVGHDWGGSLAMDRAARYPERVAGLVVLETFLRPMSWAEYPPSAVGFFRDLRTPGVGERMAIEENWFVERALPLTIADLSAEDHAVYRAPYPDPASRRPLLQWPREIPLDGEPADVRDRFLAYGRWLAASGDVPKLLLTVEPGQLVSEAMVAWARANVAALEVESVGPAGHHAPEDRPAEIGTAVAAFVQRHGLVGSAATAGGEPAR
jgi:haloalkane dehalogenase